MHMHEFRLRFSTLLCASACALFQGLAPAQENNHPPKGFTAIFNGRDFNDWTFGLTKSPADTAGMPSEERSKWQDALPKHWRVENGELVSDGQEPYLAT